MKPELEGPMINVKILKLLKKHKLPIFVYDPEIIKRQKTMLEGLLKEEVNKLVIAYSYKTNPSLGKIMYSLGCSFQLTSLKHLKEVKKFLRKEDIHKVIFNSRSLEKDEMGYLIEEGVYIVANSLNQYGIIKDFVKTHNKRVKIGIRIDTGTNPKNTFLKTTETGLGITPKQAINLPIDSENVQVNSLHSHVASQNTDPESFKQSLDTLYNIAKNKNFELEYLNIGGGFPIEYDKPVPKIDEYAKQVLLTFQDIRKKLPNLGLILEPGRYLVGPCGYLFSKVTDITKAKNYDVVVVDSSIFSSMRDRILTKYDIKFPCSVVGKPTPKSANKKYLIVGSSPSSCDVFGEYDDLPQVKIGDIVVFSQAGAYCLSNEDFTGVEKPKEFILEGNKLIKVSK